MNPFQNLTKHSAGLSILRQNGSYIFFNLIELSVINKCSYNIFTPEIIIYLFENLYSLDDIFQCHNIRGHEVINKFSLSKYNSSAKGSENDNDKYIWKELPSSSGRTTTCGDKLVSLADYYLLIHMAQDI